MLRSASSPAQDLVTSGEARHLLRAIIESSDDAIVSMDLGGSITSWNPAAARIYGYPAEEILGRSIMTLVPPDAAHEVPALLTRVRAGERIRALETIRLTRDGRRVRVSLTAAPLADGSGRIIGASVVARDLTIRELEASRWRILSVVGEAMAGTLDAHHLLRSLTALLVREMADYCVAYRVHDGEIRRIAAAHARPEFDPLVHRLTELASPTLHDAWGAGAAVRTGEPILAEVISPELLEEVATGEYLEVLRELSPTSSIVLPLRARANGGSPGARHHGGLAAPLSGSGPCAGARDR